MLIRKLYLYIGSELQEEHAYKLYTCFILLIFFFPPGPVRCKEQYQDGPGSPGPKPQWCRQCKVVVLGNGVRKPTKDQQSKAQVGAYHLSLGV